MEFQFHKEVTIPINRVTVYGELIVPVQTKGVVIFSHGSGSSRFSKRNQFVASQLQKERMGTLLFDLLTPEEDRLYENRFNIELLTKRLKIATDWIRKQPFTAHLPIGYFGASTGAASALKAASTDRDIVAVVSRGGRPDLVINDLPKVEAPTLLIVGSLDAEVLRLNQLAYETLCCEKRIEIVEGATHLFEESGKMEMVATLGANWFKKHVGHAKFTN